MTLAIIFLACVVAGNGSVWLANILLRSGSRLTPAGGVSRESWLSASAGALLATALLHLLPEALESGEGLRSILATVLAGVLFAFILERAELWHHGHEHPAAPGHIHVSGGGSWTVLVGDAMHSTADGVVIAAAFIADPKVGALVTLAILVHEVPHHIGDLVAVGGVGGDALARVSLASTLTLVGGLAGWALADQARAVLPFFLAFAASSFVYVALADLVPQLRQPASANAAAWHVGSLVAGIAAVAVATRAVGIH